MSTPITDAIEDLGSHQRTVWHRLVAEHKAEHGSITPADMLALAMQAMGTRR